MECRPDNHTFIVVHLIKLYYLFNWFDMKTRFAYPNLFINFVHYSIYIEWFRCHLENSRLLVVLFGILIKSRGARWHIFHILHRKLTIFVVYKICWIWCLENNIQYIFLHHLTYVTTHLKIFRSFHCVILKNFILTNTLY